MAAGVEATPKDVESTERLKAYWAFGEGRAKWAESPKPFTTLHALLSKYVHGHQLDGLTANIFHMALGFWPSTPHKGAVPTPGAKR